MSNITVSQRKYFVTRIENSINDKISLLKQTNAADVQAISERAYNKYLKHIGVADDAHDLVVSFSDDACYFQGNLMTLDEDLATAAIHYTVADLHALSGSAEQSEFHLSAGDTIEGMYNDSMNFDQPMQNILPPPLPDFT